MCANHAVIKYVKASGGARIPLSIAVAGHSNKKQKIEPKNDNGTGPQLGGVKKIWNWGILTPSPPRKPSAMNWLVGRDEN